MEYTLKHYAHLGDAVWELFVRELVVMNVHSQKQMHESTVACVNADFQANMLEKIDYFLNEADRELIRRGRNLPTTINKKNNQKIHRAATAFEVFVGYLYVQEPERLGQLWGEIKDDIMSK